MGFADDIKIMVTLLPQAVPGVIKWQTSPAGKTCYIYLDGVLAGSTASGSYRVPLSAGDSAIIEIYDDPATPPAAQPARITVGWDASPAASRYEIQQYQGGAWVTVKTLIESGETYYRWISPRLADSQTHRIRLATYGIDGIPAYGEEMQISIARHPDMPPQNFTLNPDFTIRVQ